MSKCLRNWINTSGTVLKGEISGFDFIQAVISFWE